MNVKSLRWRVGQNRCRIKIKKTHPDIGLFAIWMRGGGLGRGGGVRGGGGRDSQLF